MFGIVKNVIDKLNYFSEPAIEVSRFEMDQLIKDTKFRYMRVWSKKLDGIGLRRVMETRSPTGNPPRYNYQARGYWVMYSQTDRGWRTIVLNNVTKIKLGNQVYKIR
jgi:hypothetical protein